MTKDEALKLALEAFEEINKLSVGENAICLPAEIDTAMDACRKVLAQQPEPVIDKSAAVRIATSLGWEPKRTWVGLTDEEIDTILKRGDVAEHDSWNGRWYVLPYSFAQAIETKLKEKNHG